MEIINNNENRPLNTVNLVANLAEKTKNFSYIAFMFSLMGFSPETIDEKIINHRKLEKNSNLEK
ncbi:MAG: hypothetical protein PHQ62_01445 [Clostridia bacterium]|nr:hypothetical protein [Clostridia bacterium]